MFRFNGNNALDKEILKGKIRANLNKIRERKTIPHVILRGIEMKSCSRCGSLKPLEEFYDRSSGVSSDGKYSYCKDCNHKKGNSK